MLRLEVSRCIYWGMLSIATTDIEARIRRDNPWWDDPQAWPIEGEYPRRTYFEHFKRLALNVKIRRAAVLLGPRRVGKTVIIRQLIADCLQSGWDPKSILYVSIDAPIYANIALEKFIEFIPVGENQPKLIIFDEIQYLRDWERHLKDLVDNYQNYKFVVTGSAAAALKLKSNESGAGRFSEFMLPPLNFYEFIGFIDKHEMFGGGGGRFSDEVLSDLNTYFLDYLNYGGYPEVVLNEEIRGNSDQFVRNDIIEKVLLKDLPSLYGISDIRGLNNLFSFLAYNSGKEASWERISSETQVNKQTMKKYVEYLESAFLLIKVGSVDDNCRTLKRERNFKIFLNNPSMRAALFAPVKAGDTDLIGHLAEGAIFAQLQSFSVARSLRYARWKTSKSEGEVDIVSTRAADQRAEWVAEIKWSDRYEKDREKTVSGLRYFLAKELSASGTDRNIPTSGY